MIDKDGIVNQFECIKNKIEENYEQLTIAQYKSLEAQAEVIWRILDTRKGDRRK